jgi:hypothetical protein
MIMRAIRGGLAVGACLLVVGGFAACGKEEPAKPTTPPPAANTPKPANTAPANTAPAVNPEDAAMKKAVEESITKAGVTGITVKVDNKVVTLTGTATDANMKKAVQAANEVKPAPASVKNEIVKS